MITCLATSQIWKKMKNKNKNLRSQGRPNKGSKSKVNPCVKSIHEDLFQNGWNLSMKQGNLFCFVKIGFWKENFSWALNVFIHTWANGHRLYNTSSNKGCVTLWCWAFTFASVLRQKKNYENSNISPCQNIIFFIKKPSKTNQNPSRY